MRQEEIEARIEEIFGKWSSLENAGITAREKVVERIVDMSKRERQFEEWETMRREAKKR